MISQKEFFEKYDIISDEFKSSGLDWKILETIYYDYESHIEDLEGRAEALTKKLRKSKKVHSIKYRIKDPEHLIEKIIRKTIKDESREINHLNYLSEIRDLIGIRIIHLFKTDCREISDFIKNEFKFISNEINIREGDSKDFFKGLGFLDKEIITNERNYRSIHCEISELGISNKVEVIPVEIQIRTIFEEGWSEIDHSIRYPINDLSKVTNYYLDLFNRFSGAIDEMGNFLGMLQKEEKKWEENDSAQKKSIEELKEKISKSKLSAKEKEDLSESIKSINTINPYNNFNASYGVSIDRKGISGTITPSITSTGVVGINNTIGIGDLTGDYSITKDITSSVNTLNDSKFCEKCGKYFYDLNNGITVNLLCKNCREIGYIFHKL